MMSIAVATPETGDLLNPMNSAPAGFDAGRDLAGGLYGFLSAPAPRGSRRASRNWR